MKHELIEMSKWPTMPVPMQSSDAGEAWAWGDYFATLQKNPKVVSQAMEAMLGKPSTTAPPMIYPYAMMVFYNKSRNPHGPSSRPVMCIGLEQANYSALSALLGENSTKFIPDANEEKGPLHIGVFYGGGRINHGLFDGFVTADTARSCFFEIIRSHLGLTGDPVRIGTIRDVYGHEKTGWPANGGSAGSKKGCAAVFATIFAFVVLWGAFVIALK